MARTVIEERSTEPGYATEAGVSQGVIIGLLIAAVVVVVAILAATGVFRDGNSGNTTPGVVNNNNAPSAAPQNPSAPNAVNPS